MIDIEIYFRGRVGIEFYCVDLSKQKTRTMSNIIKSAAYPTTKLIKKKIVKGTEVCVYRHPIMAGMEFLLSTGKVIGPAIRQVGYYDYTIVTSAIGETISEKSHTKVFFKR